MSLRYICKGKRVYTYTYVLSGSQNLGTRSQTSFPVPRPDDKQGKTLRHPNQVPTCFPTHSHCGCNASPAMSCLLHGDVASAMRERGFLSGPHPGGHQSVHKKPNGRRGATLALYQPYIKPYVNPNPISEGEAPWPVVQWTTVYGTIIKRILLQVVTTEMPRREAQGARPDAP